MRKRIRSKASLRISGDTLVPDAVTRLLGCEPTMGRCKGDVIRGKRTGREHIQRTGIWSLHAEDRGSEDLNVQVAEILDRLNPNLEAWAALAKEFRIDLFCGLFMAWWNEGVSLSPYTLAALGSRGIELSLDLYSAPDDEDDADGSAA